MKDLSKICLVNILVAFNQSYEVQTMPLVINGLRGGDTHTHPHKGDFTKPGNSAFYSKPFSSMQMVINIESSVIIIIEGTLLKHITKPLAGICQLNYSILGYA